MQAAIASPLYITMHASDNVAIVANDGGLPAGTVFPCGLTLRDHVPQGHKVALQDLAQGSAVRRYNVPIGYALKDIPAGSWVHERLLQMPDALGLDKLPIATVKPEPMAPLEGYTFEGYRNADGSVGTRNILAITQTVQCVAGVTEFAVQRIKDELLPRYPNVDDVVALEHGYGCGVAIDAPDAVVPIRTLRNISLNPNFGGEVMLVSLGCEKLQPERLMPPGTIAVIDERQTQDAALDVVCLQDEAHVGFMSMVESILRQAEVHLKRLNARRRETVPASELVVGVQCGGSDAFSGVTANPAVGFCTDLLVRAGASVNDIMGGMFGAIGAMAALAAREKTGKGQEVQSALFENNVFLVAQHMMQYAVTGQPAAPMPGRISAWAVYDVFTVKDGEQLFLAAVSDSQWKRLCEAFGFADLLAAPRLASNNLRVQARDWMMPMLRERLAGHSAAHLSAVFEANGLPFAPITQPEALFDDPHLNQTGGLAPLTLADGRETRVPLLPLTLDGERPGLRLQPPQLGEHSAQLLRELGYSDEQVASLCRRNITVSA